MPLSRAASPLAPPPPPILLTCHFLAVKRGCCRPAHHLRSSQTAGSKLWISPPENQDRPPARQSAPYDCPVDKHPRHAEETSATKSNRRSPRPHDGRTKKQRKCGSTHYVALPHTAITGVTKLTHTPPTLLASRFTHSPGRKMLCINAVEHSWSRRDVTRWNPPYCSRVSSQRFPL